MLQRTRLAVRGVASVKLPPRSPNLNAHAERFVRTIQGVMSGAPDLIRQRLGSERAAAELMVHITLERNHQGLDNIELPGSGARPGEGRAKLRERLGRLPNYYY